LHSVQAALSTQLLLFLEQAQQGLSDHFLTTNNPFSDAVEPLLLRSIRAAISAEETSRVRLVLIELTSSEGGMPPLLEPRLMADIQMLTLFGSGKERDVRQFEALLAASGFSLVCMVPTVGLLMVLEAQPV
jgi:hypothetical protein